MMMFRAIVFLFFNSYYLMTPLSLLFTMWLYNRNAITGRYYHGIENQLMLKQQWYDSKQWMTFNQAKQHWYKIKKGEKSVRVKFETYPLVSVTDKDQDITYKRIPYVRYYNVFNTEQLEFLWKQKVHINVNEVTNEHTLKLAEMIG